MKSNNRIKHWKLFEPGPSQNILDLSPRHRTKIASFRLKILLLFSSFLCNFPFATLHKSSRGALRHAKLSFTKVYFTLCRFDQKRTIYTIRISILAAFVKFVKNVLFICQGTLLNAFLFFLLVSNENAYRLYEFCVFY